MLLALLSGCARVDSTVRTERGPLLRSFTRSALLEGGLRGELQVSWPELAVRVTEHDVCRELAVDEYAEERITERSVPATGASLSTGIVTALGGAIALGASLLVSDAPDTSTIDVRGRYGVSPRAQVQGWSLVSIGVGVPALVVGLISWLRSGVDVEQRRVEQETGQRDTECHLRPVSGPVTFTGPRGTAGTITLTEGLGTLVATEAKGSFDEVRFADRPVALDETGAATLEAFSACVQLEREGSPALDSLGEGALLTRAERLRSCRQVRGAVLAASLEGVEAELSRRREAFAPGAFAPGATVTSFEEAVSAWAPRLTLKAGSADLAKLDAPDQLEGQAVFMAGVVSWGLAENIGVLQLGERQVFVFIPTTRAWGGDFSNGARVEAVAVMVGWQTVGERTLPLARLVWLRTAF